MHEDKMKEIQAVMREKAVEIMHAKIEPALYHEMMLTLFREWLYKHPEPIQAFSMFIANWKDKVRDDEISDTHDVAEALAENLPACADEDTPHKYKQTMYGIISQVMDAIASGLYKDLFDDTKAIKDYYK